LVTEFAIAICPRETQWMVGGNQSMEIEPEEINEDQVAPLEELSGLDMGFSVVEGFSRPDWKAISRFVHDHVAKDHWSEAWKYIGSTWLKELAGDLGGKSQIYESYSFFCLSDLEPEIARTLLDYAETVVSVIRNGLKDAAWSGYYGKHVLLIFSEKDDYYTYISYFHGEGTHILTRGVFIHGGYAHIALPYIDTGSAQRTLAHELCHNLVCHLPIPLWLNEGIATMVQQKMSSNREFIVDHELADRHRSHWNETNIQTFWAGKSFNIPGDDSELSYSLSQILVTLLTEDSPDFIEFVKQADWRDAGQDAAQSIMEKDLGEVVGGFLGDGNWRPQRKAIAEQFRKPEPKPQDGTEK
jgi:hypothetical protein